MARLNRPTRMGLTVVAVLVAIFGLRTAVVNGWIPGVGAGKSVSLKKSQLPDIREARLEGVEPSEYPSAEKADLSGPQVRFMIWTWQAQTGLIYANGGAETTQGSFMAKHGVNLRLIRQEDTVEMTNQITACAQELAESDECPSGIHFMAIMGDQTAAFFENVNPTLKKICDDCTLEWIGSAGRSNGEDALLGPQSWKDNPSSIKGGVVAAAPREGDWNIAVFYAVSNDIKVNPNSRVYDPDALNFIDAATYTDASEKWVSNYCEERPIAKDGKLTGEKKKVCVEGVATWTPADYTAVSGRPGLVRVVSTKEYRGQMPNAIIGIKKWNKSHPKIVAGMLAAIFEAGDQIRAYDAHKNKAFEVAHQFYNGEQTPEWWRKYFGGTNYEDSAGNVVELGGSKVFGLNDNLALFGLSSGSTNTAKATYKVFGDFVSQLYPKEVPSYPKFEEVFNPQYLNQAKSLVSRTSLAKADTQKFSSSQQSAGVVGRQTIYVQFDTGRATLKPAGREELAKLARQLAVAGGTMVILHGYTDNVGDPESNVELSKARAKAVKDYLTGLAPEDFSSARFRVFGHGQEDPIADNSTESGRAQNRRVKVVLANPKEQ